MNCWHGCSPVVRAVRRPSVPPKQLVSRRPRKNFGFLYVRKTRSQRATPGGRLSIADATTSTLLPALDALALVRWRNRAVSDRNDLSSFAGVYLVSNSSAVGKISFSHSAYSL